MKNALNNVEKRIARLISGTAPHTAPAAIKVDILRPDPVTQQRLEALLRPGREDNPR